MAKNVDHTGFENGFIRLLKRVPPGHRRYMATRTHYFAECLSCGVKWVTESYNAVRGTTRSCGCRAGEFTWSKRRERYGSHGMRRLAGVRP